MFYLLTCILFIMNFLHLQPFMYRSPSSLHWCFFLLFSMLFLSFGGVYYSYTVFCHITPALLNLFYLFMFLHLRPPSTRDVSVFCVRRGSCGNTGWTRHCHGCRHGREHRHELSDQRWRRALQGHY